MNRVRQKIKAWKQNSKIRQVPYWRTEWMGKNPSAQNYESCMEERDSYVEEMAKEQGKEDYEIYYFDDIWSKKLVDYVYFYETADGEKRAELL